MAFACVAEIQPENNQTRTSRNMKPHAHVLQHVNALLVGIVTLTALSPLQAALVARLAFDDPANLTADSSGNGNHATASGSPSAAPGIAGGAVSFNGAIDEPTLYRRALSDQEIAALHAAGDAGKVRPPTLAFAQVGGVLQLVWPGQKGVSYQLQSATNLSATTWLNLGAPFPGTGGVLMTNLSISPEPARFFRLWLGN
jgi:hypothetical protein